MDTNKPTPEYENRFYPIENNKSEFFYINGGSFCFVCYTRFIEMFATIKEKDLLSFAAFLKTNLDYQDIYDAAKIKLKGLDIDKFKILLTENNIKFESYFWRDD